MLVAVGALVLSVLAVVGSLSSRVTTEQIRRFLGEEDFRRAEMIAGQLGPVFEEYFLSRGSWLGVDDLITELVPRAPDTAILLLDSQLGYAASSEARLTGVTGRLNANGALHMFRKPEPGDGENLGVIELVVGNGWAPLSDGHGGTAGTLIVLPGLGGHGRHSMDLTPSIRYRVMAIIAIAGLFTLAATWWLTSRMLAPVSELTEVAREMAAGRLDRRVNERSNDEIGRLSAAFNAMAGGIERSEILRRTMVSDVAHELRTPLTGMRCQIEALQDGLLEPEPAVFDSLHDDILSLQRLVEDLQELAIAEAGGLTLDLQPIDIECEVEAVQRSMTNGDGSTIEVDIGTLQPVKADRERLRQILRNLLDNSRQHAGGKARIVVSAASAGDIVEVSIQDSGPGIPPEHLDLVFERFYRVEPSRQRKTGGAGLGLAITRQLVLAHGGHIRAENAADGGARFVFTLPISSAADV